MPPASPSRCPESTQRLRGSPRHLEFSLVTPTTPHLLLLPHPLPLYLTRLYDPEAWEAASPPDPHSPAHVTCQRPPWMDMPQLRILLQRDFRKIVNSQSVPGVLRGVSEARTLPPVCLNPTSHRHKSPRLAQPGSTPVNGNEQFCLVHVRED